MSSLIEYLLFLFQRKSSSQIDIEFVDNIKRKNIELKKVLKQKNLEIKALTLTNNRLQNKLLCGLDEIRGIYNIIPHN